jgi:hypothetical protein
METKIGGISMNEFMKMFLVSLVLAAAVVLVDLL